MTNRRRDRKERADLLDLLDQNLRGQSPTFGGQPVVTRVLTEAKRRGSKTWYKVEKVK